MTREIKRRRGTTAQHAAFTGAIGEFTFDTDKKVVVAHDGVKQGGYPAARADQIAEVGVVADYAGTAAPGGWLFCYGQNISRTTYAALFAKIGTTYGVGNGTTTFALPDLRGRVVAGKDDMGGSSANRLTAQSGGLDGDMLGAAGGAETHVLTTAQMPSHGHGLELTFGYQGTGGGQGVYPSSGYASGYQTGLRGDGLSHNNVQPTIALNKIIYAGA